MRAVTGISLAVLAVVVGGASSAAADRGGDPVSVRRASVMRAQAAEMREKAAHLRDGDRKYDSKVVGEAKRLEARADALRQNADRLDSQQWPPSDMTSSSGSTHEPHHSSDAGTRD